MVKKRNNLCQFTRSRQSIHSLLKQYIIYEPGQGISFKIACASNEDSDQPAQMHRLIRVFAVRLNTLWILTVM